VDPELMLELVLSRNWLKPNSFSIGDENFALRHLLLHFVCQENRDEVQNSTANENLLSLSL